MEKKDINSILEALCERPLAAESDPQPPELEALCRRAAEAFAQDSGVAPPSDGELAADPDALLALLAAIYAGRETEAERAVFERAAANAAGVRLESESAFAFLDDMGKPLERAPTHLLGALTAARDEPAPKPKLWSLVPVFLTRTTSWRLAAALALLLVAGGLSWSLYGPSQGQLDAAQSSPPAATVASKAPGTAAGASQAAIAEACPPGAAATAQAAQADKAAMGKQAAPKAAMQSGTGCGENADHQLADKGAADAAAASMRAALQRAEAARQAAMARQAAEEASRKAAAATIAADRPAAVGSSAAVMPPFRFGAGDAAVPAVPPAASYNAGAAAPPPAAAPMMPPSGVGR